MIARPTLRRRLLLVLFALGTNVGVEQIAAGGHDQGETLASEMASFRDQLSQGPLSLPDLETL